MNTTQVNILQVREWRKTGLSPLQNILLYIAHVFKHKILVISTAKPGTFALRNDDIESLKCLVTLSFTSNHSFKT